MATEFEPSRAMRGLRPYDVRPSNQVGNLHKLWVLTAPFLLRRTKAEVAPHLPAKIEHTLRVPQGYRQSLHLAALTKAKASLPALRQAATIVRIRQGEAPAEPHPTPAASIRHPVSGVRHPSPPSLMTPKLFLALSIIARIATLRNTQFVVFSAFHTPLDGLAHWLREAGVPHAAMDGRLSPKRRQEISRQFKAGELAGVLCGMESCGRGHNWPQARHVILLDESWAWDRGPQSTDRIHRLTSEETVHVYRLLTMDTADEVVHANLKEKQTSNHLILDGAPPVIHTRPREDSLLLADLQAAIAANLQDGWPATSEHALEHVRWPKLRARLATQTPANAV